MKKNLLSVLTFTLLFLFVAGCSSPGMVEKKQDSRQLSDLSPAEENIGTGSRSNIYHHSFEPYFRSSGNNNFNLKINLSSSDLEFLEQKARLQCPANYVFRKFIFKASHMKEISHNNFNPCHKVIGNYQDGQSVWIETYVEYVNQNGHSKTIKSTGSRSDIVMNTLQCPGIFGNGRKIWWINASKSEYGTARFYLERKESGAGNWSTIMNWRESINEFNDNTARESTYYDYRLTVQFTDYVKQPKYSRIVERRYIPGNSTSINSPSGLRFISQSQSTKYYYANFSFTDNSNNETGFKVEVYENNRWRSYTTLGLNATSFTYSYYLNPTPPEYLQFRIKAVNYQTGKESGYSNTVSINPGH